MRKIIVALGSAVLLAFPGLAHAGSAGATADLTYVPTRINFGRVAPLSSVTAAILITNVSSQDLQYVGAQMLNGHNGTTFNFSLIGSSPNCLSLPSGILARGTSCTATVVFAPLVKGAFKDTALTMWSADGGATFSDVTGTALSGNS
jgi:hypothetical protein